MAAVSTQRHAGLVELFDSHGYVRRETAILQPADTFLDLSGEDLRRRMFILPGPEGTELCLRPEHTIPVCLSHVAEGALGQAGYSYLGPVFRQRPDESDEFLQAGIESIGRQDIAAADAEVLALALQGLPLFATPPTRVRLGDMGLLHALLDALAVQPAMKRRLIRSLAAGRGLSDVLSSSTDPQNHRHAGLLAAIDGQDRQAARAFVEDVIAIAGISAVGGRSAGEIAERFLSRAANRNGALSAEARDVLRRYLAIGTDPEAALVAVTALAREAGLDLGPALGLFEERNGFMTARGLDLRSFAFAADFARNLDYYTGFIFEVQASPRGANEVVVAGGRYDGLLRHLGAGADVPAVGFSFWLDRLAGERP